MIKYIFLGIIQGLTEFFPVSSSAHLIIMQRVLGMNGEELVLSVVLHLGTILALGVFFFKDILDLLHNIKWLLLIFVVTVITYIIGILGKSFFESLFSSVKLAAAALIVTGIILILTRRFKHAKRDMLGISDALILGFTQGAAIIPGISRSGITISTLLFRKIDRKTCFRFSFLASIPVVLGATLLEAKNIGLACKVGLGNFIIGFIFSFFSGILALWVLRIILYRAKLHYFGYYCIIVAGLTLLFL